MGTLTSSLNPNDPTNVDFNALRNQGQTQTDAPPPAQQPPVGTSNPIATILGHAAAHEAVSNSGSAATPTATLPGQAVGSDASSSAAAGDAGYVPGVDVAGQGITGGVGPAGVIAGGYTALKQIQGARNVSEGHRMSTQQALANALPTFGGSLIYNYTNLAGGKTNKDQLTRDSERSFLQKLGVADKNYNITLADGSQFNIGLDGHATLQNQGKNVDGNTVRHPYDVDFSNPFAVNANPQIIGVARQVLGPNASDKQVSDLTGMLSNAFTSNAKSDADVQKNIQAFQSQLPKDPNTAQQPGGGQNITINSTPAVFKFTQPATQRSIIAPNMTQGPQITLGQDAQGNARPVIQGVPMVNSNSYMPRFVPGSMAPTPSLMKQVGR